MIHIMQVLCGPARHAIIGALYDDQSISTEDVRAGWEVLIEEMIERRVINRHCVMCDAPIKQFVYEDGVAKEQDWDKAEALVKQQEAEQMWTQEMVVAARKAARN
jgi:hypothetical protein